MFKLSLIIKLLLIGAVSFILFAAREEIRQLAYAAANPVVTGTTALWNRAKRAAKRTYRKLRLAKIAYMLHPVLYPLYMAAFLINPWSLILIFISEFLYGHLRFLVYVVRVGFTGGYSFSAQDLFIIPNGLLSAGFLLWLYPPVFPFLAFMWIMAYAEDTAYAMGGGPVIAYLEGVRDAFYTIFHPLYAFYPGFRNAFHVHRNPDGLDPLGGLKHFCFNVGLFSPFGLLAACLYMPRSLDHHQHTTRFFRYAEARLDLEEEDENCCGCFLFPGTFVRRYFRTVGFAVIRGARRIFAPFSSLKIILIRRAWWMYHSFFEYVRPPMWVWRFSQRIINAPSWIRLRCVRYCCCCCCDDDYDPDFDQPGDFSLRRWGHWCAKRGEYTTRDDPEVIKWCGRRRHFRWLWKLIHWRDVKPVRADPDVIPHDEETRKFMDLYPSCSLFDSLDIWELERVTDFALVSWSSDRLSLRKDLRVRLALLRLEERKVLALAKAREIKASRDEELGPDPDPAHVQWNTDQVKPTRKFYSQLFFTDCLGTITKAGSEKSVRLNYTGDIDYAYLAALPLNDEGIEKCIEYFDTLLPPIAPEVPLPEQVDDSPSTAPEAHVPEIPDSPQIGPYRPFYGRVWDLGSTLARSLSTIRGHSSSEILDALDEDHGTLASDDEANISVTDYPGLGIGGEAQYNKDKRRHFGRKAKSNRKDASCKGEAGPSMVDLDYIFQSLKGLEVPDWAYKEIPRCAAYAELFRHAYHSGTGKMAILVTLATYLHDKRPEAFAVPQEQIVQLLSSAWDFFVKPWEKDAEPVGEGAATDLVKNMVNVLNPLKTWGSEEEELARRVSLISNSLRGTEYIAGALVQTAVALVKYLKVAGGLDIDPDSFEGRVQEFISRATEIQKVPISRFTSRDIDEFISVMNLGLDIRKDLHQHQNRIANLSQFTATLATFKSHMAHFEQVKSQALARPKPVLIKLSGKGGLGKSFLSNRLVDVVLAHLGHVDADGNPDHAYVYSHTNKDVRFDGYWNQTAVIKFPELFTSTNKEYRSEMANLLLQISDHEPYKPEMAGNEAKGVTYCAPRCIIITTNASGTFTAMSGVRDALSDPGALDRRVFFDVELVPRLQEGETPEEGLVRVKSFFARNMPTTALLDEHVELRLIAEKGIPHAKPKTLTTVTLAQRVRQEMDREWESHEQVRLGFRQDLERLMNPGEAAQGETLVEYLTPVAHKIVDMRLDNYIDFGTLSSAYLVVLTVAFCLGGWRTKVVTLLLFLFRGQTILAIRRLIVSALVWLAKRKVSRTVNEWATNRKIAVVVGLALLGALVMFLWARGRSPEVKETQTSVTTVGEQQSYKRVRDMAQVLMSSSIGTMRSRSNGLYSSSGFIALGGEVIVIVTHARRLWTPTTTIEFVKPKAATLKINASDLELLAEDGELSFMRIRGYRGRTIVQHLLSETALPRDPVGVYGLVRDHSSDSDNVVVHKAENVHYEEGALTTESTGNVRVVSKGYYRLEMFHGQGMCMTPYVWEGGRGKPALLCLHVGGSGRFSYAIPITREHIQALPSEAKTAMRMYEEGEKQYGIAEPFSMQVCTGETFQSVPPGATYIGHAENSFSASVGSVSNIVKTPLAEIFKPSSAPCHLSPFVNEAGETIDPLQTFLKKLARPTVYGSRQMITRWTKGMWKRWQPPRFVELTWDRALNGETGTNLLPLTIATSAGHAFRKHVHEGKKPLISHNPETGKFEMSPKMAKHMEEYLELLDDAIAPNLNKDNKKDERKPLHAVEQGKMRIFSSIQLDYLLAFRYLLGPFLDAIRMEFPCNISIGINAGGFDFHASILHLRSAGIQVAYLAGDVKGWDMSIPYMFHERIIDEILDWCAHYIPGFDRRRALHLLEAGSSHFHILMTLIYVRLGGIASGHPATAEFNSIMHIFLIKVAFCEIMAPYFHDVEKAFYDHVRVVVYGDDHVIAVDAEVCQEFNMITLAKWLHDEFEMEYTMPDKTPIVEKFIPFEKLEYLKRTPRVLSELPEYFVGALPLDVCVDIALFTRTTAIEELGEQGAWTQNMEAALREIFFHGRETFDYYYDAFTTHYASFGVHTTLTYDKLLQEFVNTF